MIADIVTVQKRKNMVSLIPSGIEVEFKNGQRCVLSSFFDRDLVFELIVYLRSLHIAVSSLLILIALTLSGG
jgi:hypothetical protein